MDKRKRTMTDMDMKTKLQNIIAVAPMTAFYLVTVSCGDMNDKAKAIYADLIEQPQYELLKAGMKVVDTESPDFFQTLQSSIDSPAEYFQAFTGSISAIMDLEEAFNFKKLLFDFSEDVATHLSRDAEQPEGYIKNEYDGMLAAMVNLLGMEENMDRLGV